MKNLNQYIQEKYLIGSNTSGNDIEYDAELISDYEKISSAITKAEKKAIADKYGFKDLRIRPIQIGILDLLRENRQYKKSFNDNDVLNFIRYDISERYTEFKKYLDEEPKDFVEYILNYYIEQAKKQRLGTFLKSRMSSNQKYILKRIDQLQNYLHKYIFEIH